MGPTIAATVFGAFGVLAAFLMRPRFANDPAILRAVIFWLIAVPVMFLVMQVIPALIILGGLLAILTPRHREERAAFYLMTLVAVPSSISGELPFPGINYLTEIDFAKVACLVLLAPVVLFGKGPIATRYAPAAGVLILLLTLYFSVLEFRTANLTSGLRATVDNFLLYAIPVMALLRMISSTEQFERIFACLMFIAIVFFFSAIISQVTRWNFYSYIMVRHGVPSFADFRTGMLRVSVTMNPILVCYIATLGLIAVSYFRASMRLGFLQTWLYRGMFCLTGLFTFARGGWLAMVSGLAVFYLFSSCPRGLRTPIIAAAIFIGVPTAFGYALTADLNQYDEYGTFAYRQELLRTSIDNIIQRPLFGDAEYRTSGRFDHLIQGQGIIDVVNHYVHIALKTGLIGLALYLGAFLAVISGLLSLGKNIRLTDDQTLERRRAVLLAALIAYLVMMATVSAVSLASQIGVALLALGAAFVAAARAEKSVQLAAGRPDASTKAEDPGLARGDLNA